jgi:amino acid adenylation domain-containing protein
MTAPKREIEKIYSLSPLQEGMFLASVRDPAARAYFEQYLLTLTGDVDHAVLQATVDELVRRHDVLRTTFVDEKVRKPMQVVLKEARISVGFEDLSALAPADQQARVDDIRRLDLERGFNLTRDALTRVSLIRRSATVCQLLWSTHHILMDGWSTSLVFGEFLEIYRALRGGRRPTLDPPQPFQKYIAWLAGRDPARSLSWWRDQLAGYDEPTGLPKRRDGSVASEFCQHAVELDEGTTTALIDLARSQRVTLNVVVQALWSILLARYADRDDVVFGTVVSGRPPDLAGMDRVVGLCINTLPVRARVGSDRTLAGLLADLQQHIADSQPHQHSALADIQNQTPLRQSLLDHIVVFENYPVQVTEAPRADDQGFAITDVSVHEQTSYGLGIAVRPGKRLGMHFGFDAAAHSPALIARVGDQFMTLAGRVAHAAPDTPLGSLEILTTADVAALTSGVNDTRASYPADATITSMFEEQACRRGDGTALVTDSDTWSYAALDRWSSAIAAALTDGGVAHGECVAIGTAAPPSMVAGILGILKAGAVYVPLSSEAPASRIAFIVADSESRVVIDDAWLAERGLRDAPPTAVARPAAPISPDDVAYVIYTSGSTGQPKGCAVTHRNVVRLLTNDRFPFQFSHDDTWIVAHAFAFDFSVWEMYGALLYGGRLVVAPRDTVRDSAGLLALVKRHQVTVLNQTPGAFEALIEVESGAFDSAQARAEAPGLNKHLRYVIFGGDRLEPSRLRRWTERYPLSQIALINMYGITETTVHVTVHRLTPDDVANPAVSPIGRPLPETTVYLLDRRQQPVPLGATGEMFVGGTGVSRGYLRQPELTAARFLPDPFVPGGRVYRSGDLAWRRDDGTLGFVGRADHQLKIRGFRVEPGEIEHAIRAQPGVQAAVVVGHRDAVGATSLVAYVVADDSQVPGALRTALAGVLPDYLVPAHIVPIAAIPLTSNGKLDRAALPAPGASASPQTGDAPLTPAETALAGIWKTVLGRTSATLADHFFDLGGHSLAAMRLVAQVRSAGLGTLHMDDVFETPTLGALAQRLESANPATGDTAAGEPPIARLHERASYALSPAQRRLWVIEQLDAAQDAYLITNQFSVRGNLNIDALRAALGDLIARHEILRTAIVVEHGTPMQAIAKTIDVPLVVEDRAGWSPGPSGPGPRFDLARAPLWRVSVQRSSDEASLLTITVHHLLVDAWSLELLVKELADAYAARSNGRAPSWTPLPIQYRDVSAWQLARLASGALESSRQYWLKTLAPPLPVLDLPTDAPRPAVKSYAGAAGHHRLPPDLADALLALGRAHNATPFMTLLSLVALLLSRLTGQHEMVIATPVATRTRPELAGQVGLYLNTLALRLRIDTGADTASLLAHVRDTATAGLAHADYPFDALVEDLQLPRDLSRMPVADVLVVVQAAPEQGLDLPGVALTPLAQPATTSKFDLTFFLTHGPAGVDITIEYATALFRADRIARLCMQIETLARAATASPARAVGTLGWMPDAERTAVVDTFNDTTIERRDIGLDALLIDAAIRHGEKPALVHVGHSLTYAELFARARQVAGHLRAQGIGRDDLVALQLPRSLDLVISLLGIVLAGAAVLPIDADTPPARVAQILEASGARMSLAGPPEAGPHDPEESWRPASAEPGDLLYVIYTSGSTGTPKGVMVEHRTMVNLIEHQLADPSLAFQSVLQFAPIGFDVSLQEIFTTFAAGGTLHLIDPELRLRVRELWAFVADRKISTLFLPTAYLRMLMSQPALFDAVPACVRHIITAGEQLVLPDSARATLARVALHNHYGPAETHVATTWTLAPGEPPPAVPPIGRPIGNTRVYLLDAAGMPVPIGVPGELHIAGAAVGRGYRGRPAETGERFSADPFAGGRMYRTGDRAQWREDGQLEFLGRADDQIKVRGYRVEPGEIEAVLLTHPSVRSAGVVARAAPAGELDVWAYVVIDGAMDDAAVRAHVARALPDYMVPARIVAMDALPLTPNGKLDRRRLPDPASDVRVADPPADELESQLAALWKDVLGRDVGVTDDFFAAGGSSLRAVHVTAEVQARFGVDAPLALLYRHPTVRQLARFIADTRRHGVNLADDYLSFNEGAAGPAMFWFPPFLGTAISYAGLAARIPSSPLHAFNFLDRSDRVDAYARSIVARQPKGPYVLAGYSAGGRLAYHVATHLAAAGHSVSDLILMDAAPRPAEAAPVSDAALRGLVDDALAHAQYERYLTSEFLLDRLRALVVSYLRYYTTYVEQGPLTSRLHLVRSTTAVEGIDRWTPLINGPVRIVQGAGEHNHMLDAEFVGTNAALIAEVFHS